MKNHFLSQLEKEPNIGPFIDPVDWKGLGLDDYPKIVKKPMDLSTVRQKVNKNKYTSDEEFYEDVMQIWINCKSYNIAESEIYRMAEDLERTCKKLYKKYLQPAKESNQNDKDNKSPREEEDEEEGDISFDERIKFTDYVRRLTIENMTELVKMIQDLCPKCLEDLDSEKLQIKVNEIDRVNFTKFFNFALEKGGAKETAPRVADREQEEKAKSNQDDNDDPMKGDSKPVEKLVKKEENDEEFKNDQPIDSAKYGPEGKKFKSS